MSTAGFLTGKVFLFGCCEPLRSFRYIDSLSHLHLEIITIYMSTSIFMYTCHMFAGSFQNQGSILKKIYIYIYTTHQSSMCIQKGSTFCFGSVFSNTHHGPFTSFPHGLPRPEPMAKWVDEAMALCMPLCGIAKEVSSRQKWQLPNRCRNEMTNWMVVSNVFYFHPYLGKVSILTNIFQRG